MDANKFQLQLTLLVQNQGQQIELLKEQNIAMFKTLNELMSSFTSTMVAFTKMLEPQIGGTTMAVDPDCISDNGRKKCRRKRARKCSGKNVEEKDSMFVSENCNDELATDDGGKTIIQSKGAATSNMVVKMGRVEMFNPLEADSHSHIHDVSPISTQLKIVDGFERHVIPKDSVFMSEELGSLEEVCVSPKIGTDQLQPESFLVMTSGNVARSEDMKLCRQGARVDGYGSKEAPSVLAQRCKGENCKFTGLTAGTRSEIKSRKDNLCCKYEGLAHFAMQECPLEVADVPGPRSLNSSKEVLSYKNKGLAHFAMQELPLDVENVARATREDPLYVRLLLTVEYGLFDHQEVHLGPFLPVMKYLTVDEGCLLYQRRVVIPPSQQERLLYELHQTNRGADGIKSMAKKYIWWPTLDADIESMTVKCSGCVMLKDQSSRPLIQRPWATRPMEKIQVCVTNYRGDQLLVVVDAYTRFVWTYIMGSKTTTSRVLSALEFLFEEYGTPDFIVSSKNTLYTSKRFVERMAALNIRHIVQPKEHPWSNKLAEDIAKLITSKLHKIKATSSSLHSAVTKIVSWCRSHPIASINSTPSKLMESSAVKTPLPVIHHLSHIGSHHKQYKRRLKEPVKPHGG